MSPGTWKSIVPERVPFVKENLPLKKAFFPSMRIAHPCTVPIVPAPPPLAEIVGVTVVQAPCLVPSLRVIQVSTAIL